MDEADIRDVTAHSKTTEIDWMATKGAEVETDGYDITVPNEILAMILGHLHASDAIVAAWVNRRWYACAPPRPPQLGSRKGNEYYMEQWAKKGYLNVVKWARNNGCPWSRLTCARAAYGGWLDLVKWARENGCPWDESTCAGAASGGHLDVLEWARASGCEWDERTCAKAAKGGHLGVLQWARANGCPWDKQTCDSAAYSGHTGVLFWAHENGCPWDEKTYHLAAEHRDPLVRSLVLLFMNAQGCPTYGDPLVGRAKAADMIRELTEFHRTYYKNQTE
ncbi:Ankyrin repeat domain containing protein [Pandoravirus neocaledonia]|uniref:Ankyrin repeat domain containing protein n=1 Tax=Pandoravirus neocaledonia TaxID=2107708 RepID=A0A2U7UD12_9VIRU|nr:Ankyrin repeat domain containing protein [Pandoravirus neocaledonia]AVK76359.1 Ankyrin repeat domain containing protein [Pandoravirus neocaledonia]